MNQIFYRLCITFVAVTFCTTAIAQSPTIPRDTTRKPNATPNATANQGPKPYKEVITDKAITRRGMFIVHKVDEKYYFELPNKLLGRDILVVNRVSKSSIESQKALYGYAGDQIGT